jgi:hypothetical protein
LVVEAPFVRESDWGKQLIEQLLSSAGLDVVTTLVVVLIALGFAFNYIASAPAFLIHLYRCFIVSADSTDRTWSSWGLLLFGLFFVFLLAGLLVVLNERFAMYGAAIVVSAFILAVVLAIAPFVVLGVEAKSIKDFYHSLSKGRADASAELKQPAKNKKMKARAARREYIESYRHLREHGNAYSIVILNILLVCVLSVATTIQQAALIIVFWTLPAALGWYVGTLLENDIRD